jgi:death on curing protein
VKEPFWIDSHDAVALHERLLALDGGASGLRDGALLDSALARPRQIHVYEESADVVDLAAAYIAGIVRNHPFIDGNKRTGFLAGILFLEFNGHLFTAQEEDATQAVFALAAGTLDESGFASWLRANAKPRGKTR